MKAVFTSKYHCFLHNDTQAAFVNNFKCVHRNQNLLQVTKTGVELPNIFRKRLGFLEQSKFPVD